MNIFFYLRLWKYCNFPWKKNDFFTIDTVCLESSDPSEKIFNIFASESEVYARY